MPVFLASIILHHSTTWAAKILMTPFQMGSHISEMSHIGNTLYNKGHDVHLLISPTFPDIDKVIKGNLKVITHATPDPDFNTMPQEQADELFYELLKITLIQDIRINIDGVIQLCTNVLSDDDLFRRLKSMNFDLAVVDIFPCSRCLAILINRLDLPFVALTTLYEPWLLRNPALPSFSPFNIGVHYSNRMTFVERLHNLWTVIDWNVFTGVEYLEDTFVRKYMKDKPFQSLNVLSGKALLWLISTDIAIEYPIPRMANEILIGGLTTQPAKPLPEDLAQFVESSQHGIIVVSFGSFAVNLPDPISTKFMSAFKQVKQNVIWRYPHTKPKDVPNNVKLLNWLPQNDLLGHAKTQVFITHCGASGQFESLYHGVPMVMFPMFAEQHYNAQ